MDADLRYAMYLTHTILNIIHSGYQGKYVALNIMGQLGYRDVDHEETDRTREILDKTGNWNQLMWNREPIISRLNDVRGNDEANMALEFFCDHKSELTGIADRLERILRRSDLTKSSEDVKFLIACFGRYAYARDHFIKGMVAYCKGFNLEEEADRLRQQLIVSDAEIGDYLLDAQWS